MPSPAEINDWVNLVTGKPYRSDAVVMDRGTRADNRDGKNCWLYTQTERVQLDNQTQGVRTQEVCFDIITYYPVAGSDKWQSTVNGKIDKAYTSTDHYTDFNAQIQIALPTAIKTEPTQVSIAPQVRTVTPAPVLPSATRNNAPQISKCE